MFPNSVKPFQTNEKFKSDAEDEHSVDRTDSFDTIRQDLLKSPLKPTTTNFQLSEEGKPYFADADCQARLQFRPPKRPDLNFAK